MNRDITEHKQLEKKALHDRLTGLPNRSLLADRIEHLLARRTREAGHAALLFIDLDNFKLINDTLGHHVGDELLIAVAGRLSRTARPGDTFARYGGDEFVLLCENLAHPDAALGIAERIAQALDGPFQITNATVSVTASIGIAPATATRSTAEALLRDADIAMYQAKREGPARYQLFDEGVLSRAALEAQ
jgi:diguanylate cyclase (GGDEF)-like protein